LHGREDVLSLARTHLYLCNIPFSDGRGGADGGCQRMEPELSWADNTNLIFAHKLLEPIKHKHGLGLSWGDLFVLAGTQSIEDMGGPVLGFAAGRIDQVDNSQTNGLGPSEEQERFKHAEVDGQLEEPLGQNTMGLIYVNPAGPMGVPDPQGAADTIRDVFGRMGMDDRENVALIAGGHTFGYVV
jgi:catalase-peroxidase